MASSSGTEVIRVLEVVEGFECCVGDGNLGDPPRRTPEVLARPAPDRRDDSLQRHRLVVLVHLVGPEDTVCRPCPRLAPGGRWHGGCEREFKEYGLLGRQAWTISPATRCWP